MSHQKVTLGPATSGVQLTPRTSLAHIAARLRKQHPDATTQELVLGAMEIQRQVREAAAAARRNAAQAAAKPLPTLDPTPAPAPEPPVEAKPKRAPRKRTPKSEVEGESSRW